MYVYLKQPFLAYYVHRDGLIFHALSNKKSFLIRQNKEIVEIEGNILQRVGRDNRSYSVFCIAGYDVENALLTYLLIVPTVLTDKRPSGHSYSDYDYAKLESALTFSDLSYKPSLSDFDYTLYSQGYTVLDKREKKDQ
jgi:hypothetical protein